MMQDIKMAKNIIDRDMYDYYRANRKKQALGIDQYKLWVKAINGLLMTLKQMVIENENGVYIEKFGYLRADKRLTYKVRVSILRKVDKNRNTVKFTPFEERVKRYKFTLGTMIYLLDPDKEYESKLDAIEHTINLKDNKWIR